MLCQRCKQREQTGFLVLLCDECFDEWEKEILSRSKPNPDLSVLDPAVVYQHAGGLVPDDVVSIKVQGPANLRIDIAERSTGQ